MKNSTQRLRQHFGLRQFDATVTSRAAVRPPRLGTLIAMRWASIGVREDGRVQALADNTRCAAVDQVPTMRFVPPSFQIGSGPNFEIPVGLFRPAPGFLAALEPRQVNERARELTRV